MREEHAWLVDDLGGDQSSKRGIKGEKIINQNTGIQGMNGTD